MWRISFLSFLRPCLTSLILVSIAAMVNNVDRFSLMDREMKVLSQSPSVKAPQPKPPLSSLVQAQDLTHVTCEASVGKTRNAKPLTLSLKYEARKRRGTLQLFFTTPKKNANMSFTQEDTHAINTIRVLAADTVFKSNSGHPGESNCLSFSESTPNAIQKIYFLILFFLSPLPLRMHPISLSPFY